MNEYVETIHSPDGQHVARFLFAGEIRFGPAYFGLEVDGYDLGDRLFGFHYAWHPACTYLAVQEWITRRESDGLITAIALKRRKFARITEPQRDFIIPADFQGSVVRYQQATYPRADRPCCPFDLETVSHWEDYEAR